MSKEQKSELQKCQNWEHAAIFDAYSLGILNYSSYHSSHHSLKSAKSDDGLHKDVVADIATPHHHPPKLATADEKSDKSTAKSAAEKLPQRVAAAEKKPTQRQNFPCGAWFCLGAEFFERFSFYGFRAILILYLTHLLRYESNEAKVLYHSFVSLSYFTSIFGSILADGRIGKFSVIASYMIINCLGFFIITMSTLEFKGNRVLFFVGLFTIAFGAGGIKPCIYSFTSDQFPPDMGANRKKFSSLFYFVISIGALLTELVAPILRQFDCLGKTSCYPLALGFQAGALILGLVVLVLGSKFYKIHKFSRNTFLLVLKCTCHMIRSAIAQRKRPSLDMVCGKYEENFIEDVKSLYHILLIFVPGTVFWALYDQQGSGFVLQAQEMNRHIGSIIVIPGQVQILNPLFLIILVPLFAFAIYPLIWKCNLLVRPLPRMSVGCVFAVLSFIAAGTVQYWIDNSKLYKPQAGKAYAALVNMDHNDFTGSDDSPENFTIAKNSYLLSQFRFPIRLREKCATESVENVTDDDDDDDVVYNTINAEDRSRGHVIVFWSNCSNITRADFRLRQLEHSNYIVKALFHPHFSTDNTNLTVSLISQDGSQRMNLTESDMQVEHAFSDSDHYTMVVRQCSSRGTKCSVSKSMPIRIESGAIYYLIIDLNANVQMITVISPYSVSIFWIIPQFFLITVAEILFAHSGSEFSYLQAAHSMKSTLQSLWLVSMGFGNVLDMIISGPNVHFGHTIEYFIYAVLMTVATAFFVYISLEYVYIDRDKLWEEHLIKSGKVAKKKDENSAKSVKCPKQEKDARELSFFNVDVELSDKSSAIVKAANVKKSKSKSNKEILKFKFVL